MSSLTNIQWNADGIEVPALDYSLMERWIVAVAESYDRIAGKITYIFTDDAGILKVNVEFLQHDYFTDIITFDYSRRKVVAGDVFISLDTVRTNAQLVGAEYDDELHRVIIHGVLHLCGINDKGPGEREIMEACENRALDLLSSMC